MSNSKELLDIGYCISSDANFVPLSSLRIRFKKVHKVLESCVPGKSANGLPPVFLKECAVCWPLHFARSSGSW